MTTTQAQQLQLAKAIRIACTAHQDDLDKGGNAYILHPLRLMMRIQVQYNDPEIMQIAVLHDVLEDHGELYTIEQLVSLGFSSRVVSALQLLTHAANDSYEQYIEKISHSLDATIVKLEDLKDNSDITRLKGVTDKDLLRMQRYHKAFVRLTSNLCLLDVLANK